MKIIGAVMIVILFIGLFSMPIIINRDWRAALAVFGITTGLLAWVAVAVFLLSGGEIK